MTVTDLLKLAHDELRNFSQPHPLATAVSNLLTAETCGWERPVSGVRDGEPFVEVPASWDACVSPADARVMAVMLLVAADSAEENQ